MCKLETADFRVRVASVGCGMGAAAGLLWGGRPHQQLASNPPSNHISNHISNPPSNHISDLEMNSSCKISVWPFSWRVWKIIWGLCEDIVVTTHQSTLIPILPHNHIPDPDVEVNIGPCRFLEVVVVMSVCHLPSP